MISIIFTEKYTPFIYIIYLILYIYLRNTHHLYIYIYNIYIYLFIFIYWKLLTNSCGVSVNFVPPRYTKVLHHTLMVIHVENTWRRRGIFFFLRPWHCPSHAMDDNDWQCHANDWGDMPIWDFFFYDTLWWTFTFCHGTSPFLMGKSTI